jgi:hypothetical protein
VHAEHAEFVLLRHFREALADGFEGLGRGPDDEVGVGHETILGRSVRM